MSIFLIFCENSTASPEYYEAKIKDILTQAFGCLDDCSASTDLSFHSILKSIESTYTDYSILKKANDNHDFSYSLYLMGKSPIGPTPLATATSGTSKEFLDKVANNLKTNVSPRIHKLLSTVNSQSPIELKQNKIKLIYYWRTLTSNILSEDDLKLDLSYLEHEISSLTLTGEASSLEYAFLLHRACDVLSSIKCETIQVKILENSRSSIKNLNSAEELIKFSIAYSKIMSPWMHPIPGEYFFTAHDTKTISMNLLSLEASFSCHRFFTNKLQIFGNENCPSASDPNSFRWPEDLGLTFFILYARDHTNSASTALSDMYFLIRDRFFEIYSNQKERWPKYQNEVIYYWAKIMRIDLDSLVEGESGFIDDLGDGFRFFKDNGISLGTVGEIAGVVADKLAGGKDQAVEINSLTSKIINTLPGKVSLSEILSGQEAIGLMYQLNQNENLVSFEMATEDGIHSDVFSTNKENTIFSGMGIMANESYTGPAWATGASKRVISEYWNPQRDGLLIIRSTHPQLEIVHSSTYIDDLEKRANLYGDLRSGQVDFFSLGQLFLHKGDNLVDAPTSSSRPCLTRNILATNPDTGAVGYFKLYCASAYNAVEIIKYFGYSEAFNFDAFLANYDYHVDQHGRQFGTPGLKSSSYSKFNINLLNQSKFPRIVESKKCLKGHFECNLQEYMSTYPSAE